MGVFLTFVGVVCVGVGVVSILVVWSTGVGDSNGVSFSFVGVGVSYIIVAPPGGAAGPPRGAAGPTEAPPDPEVFSCVGVGVGACVCM